MEKLLYYLQWWFEFNLPLLKERRIPEEIQTSRLIPVLVGPRRSGKSAIFFLLIKQLLKEIPLGNIIYMNFEDDRLYPLDGSELAELLPVYKQNFTMDAEKPLYLFLDEIQNLPNWEKIVRRLYETESSLKLFITGSNARMLSYDIATTLRGRTLSFKTFPLNFYEYLVFKNKKPKTIDGLQYSKGKDVLLKEFDNYLKYGGFPEVVLENDGNQKERILKEYLHTIYFADIIERYDIRNMKLMDAFIKILTRQMSALFSIGKMVNTLKSIGFKVSKNTLITYLDYIEEAFLGKSVSIYSYSIKDHLQYPRKFYLLDNGLYRAASFLKDSDYGRLLENLVFIHLYKRFDQIFYWKSVNGYEVDFFIPELKDNENCNSLIQVTYDYNNEQVKKREIRSIIKAAKEFKVKKALIITKASWDNIVTEDIEIEVKPFIQWALESNE